MRASAPPALQRALLATALLVALAGALAPTVAWARPALAAVAALLAAAAAVQHSQRREQVRRRRRAALGVAHSVRTPLTLIEAYSEMLLLGRERDPEERTRWLHLIARETHRLGALVDNVVAVAHGPGPDAFPARRPVELGALVEDVAADHAGWAEERGMRLAVAVESGLVVMADSRALARALGNLIDNAVRYGPHGQTIRVSVRASGGRAAVTVADAGRGIPAAQRDRIWEPFVQLQGGDEGAGIGLTVARLVAQAHGGRALLGTAPADGGACFVLELPVVAGAVAAAAAPPVAARAAG